jgi:hypothetical protein
VRVPLVEHLLSQPGPESFRRLASALDAMTGSELDDAVDRCRAALASWPDEARAAPETAWERVQAGDPPPWWFLVRHVRVRAGDTLDVGAALEPLTSVNAGGVPVDPTPLGDAPHLRALDLAANDLVADLEFLAAVRTLERLRLANLAAPPGLAPLGGLEALRSLDLSFNPLLDYLAPAGLPDSLTWLDLSGDSGLLDIDELGALNGLEALLVEDCEQINALDFLADLPRLRSLSARGLDGVDDLTPLASTAVRRLDLGGAGITDAAPVGAMRDLDDLNLDGLPELADLGFLEQLEQLRRLTVQECPAPLPALRSHGLEHVALIRCPAVDDLSPLRDRWALRELLLDGLPVAELAPLASVPQLETLALRYCTRVRDLTPLARLPLRLVDLTGCDTELDTSPLPDRCRIVR